MHMRISLLLLFGVFALFGAVFGIWQVLVADLTITLQISSGQLGLAISGGLLASLPSMALGGRIVDRWGQQGVILGTGVLMGLALAVLALVPGYAALFAVLVLFFAMTGTYDVGINAAAMGFEQWTRRRILTYLHAAFSGGAFVAAVLTGLLLVLGTPFRAIYVGGACLVWGMLLLVWLGKPVWQSPDTPAVAMLPPRRFRQPAVLLLAVIGALATFSETALENWSAIYLRSSLTFSAIVGASGVAIFHLAMALGRTGAGVVVERLGRRVTLRVAGVLASGGMLVALGTGLPLVTLAGILIVGLALANIVPVIFSLAGDIAGERTGQVSSQITVVSYMGMLLGPATIGGLAELFGLRMALASIILLGIMITLLSLQIREP